MPSYFTPKKNTEFILYLSLVSQSNTKVMQSNPTIASGDFKVSTDGGALSNLSTLPVVTPASSKMVKITLSASEMNGDNVTIVASDVSGSEWADLVTNVHTTANQIDDLALASVVGALSDTAAYGDPTSNTLVQFVKQLVNILIGTDGIPTFPSEAAPANDVSLAEVIRAIHTDVTGLNGDVMRGTDSANTVTPDAAGVLPTAVEIRTEMDSNSTELAKIGTIPALDGAGQNIGAALAKLADDNGGADFDATTDSLQAIRDRGDAAWIGGGGLSAGDINREIGLVVSGHGLDHLLLQSVTGTDVTDDSVFAKLVSKEVTADWDDYVNTTDSLQALRDIGDTSWITATGFSTHSAAEVNREIGLVVSGHGLDNFVFTTSNKVDARIDYVGANPVTTPNDFKATVTNLDVAVSSLASPAEVSAEVGLIISGHGLDHLLSQPVAGADITDNSIFARLVSKSATADWDSFNNTTDSLEAIRDRGDAEWIGGGGLTTGDISREIGLVVSGHGLDHLLLQAVIGTDITDNSIFAKLVSASATADWDTFVNTTDSLEAIRNRGDAAWTGSGGLTTGDINREIGLVVSGHGLDHLLLQTVAGSDVTDNSIFARLVSSGTPADWDDFANTTDSLQAIRDVEPHGTVMRGTDGANTTVPDAAGIAPTAIEIRDAILSDSTPFAGANIDASISTLATFAEVNREVGLVISGHGLDNFVFTTANKVDVRVDYVGANLVTTPDDFKANISSLATSAGVNREIGLVVSGHGLDHLLSISVAGSDIADNSIFARLVSSAATADWDTFINTTDSLQAIRDRGDTAWISGGGLTAGDVSREVGLVVSGHNLDNFVFTTSNKVDARIDYVGANSVTTPDNFKADVTNLDIAVSTLATSAQVSREVGLVISGHGLDHLLLQSVTGTDITDDSIIAMLVSASATADWDDYINTTDSLQAIRDRGDSAWTTGGAGGLSAGDVSREVGLVVSGHGLDNFVFTTSNKVDARVDYVGANSVTTPDDFKAIVTNLDVAVSSLADPAEVNREVGLVISGHGLDHLLLQSVTGSDVTNDSLFARLVASGAVADWDDFSNITDSLQAIRDKLTDVETDTTEIGTAGAGLTNLGGMSTSMKAEVNAEADTALTDYDALVPGDLPANFASFSIDASGRVDVSKIVGSAEAATNLSTAVETVVTGTIDTTNFASTTTEFEADDITEATADHFNGREILFTSGILTDQATSISDYSLISGRGHFTVVALTEPAGNDDTFVIV